MFLSNPDQALPHGQAYRFPWEGSQTKTLPDVSRGARTGLSASINICFLGLVEHFCFSQPVCILWLIKGDFICSQYVLGNQEALDIIALMFTWSKQGDFHRGLLLHCHQQCPGDPTGEPRGMGTPVVTTAMGRGHVEVGRGQLGARQSHCSARGLGACISSPLAHHMAHPPTTQRQQKACKASMPTSKKLTPHCPSPSQHC